MSAKKTTDTRTTEQEQTMLDEVATQAPTSVAVVDKKPLSVAGYDVGDVGTGFEDVTQHDLKVPFLVILQKNSPQVEEGNPKFVPGAKAGMIMHTITNELIDGKVGVPVVPVHRIWQYIEWIPRDQGGGLVEIYEPNDPKVLAALKKSGKKFGKIKINDDNDLVETFNFFVLRQLEDGTTAPVILGFSSTNIDPYKSWMTTMQSIKIKTDGNPTPQVPPMFSHVYRLTTQFTQKKNNSWFRWKLDFNGTDAAACRIPQDSPLFEEAKKFRAMVMSGIATMDLSSVQQDETAESEFEM